MRRCKNCAVYFITILLIGSILNIFAVTKVIAPPVGGSSSSGFITSTDSSIQIIEANINMSITSQPIRDAYHLHTIYLEGIFNLTNPSSENEDIQILYCPFWNEYWSYFSTSFLETSIEGSPIAYTNQTLSNITHPQEFPSNFHNRFPDWIFTSEQIWFSDIPFTLMNLSLGPNQSVLFHFNGSITITSVSINYTEIGFGFAGNQIERDSTHLRMQIFVINGTQFTSVSSHPYEEIVDSSEETDYSYTWDVQPPYSAELLQANSFPIGAGFDVQMKVSPYSFPSTTTSTTTSPTTSTTTSSSSSQNILLVIPVVFATWGLFILVIVIIWKREPNH